MPEQLPNLLDRAIRVAMAERTPTCLIIPSDVQQLNYEPPSHTFKQVPSSLGTEWPTVTPDEAGLQLAAEVLNEGERVAILVGQGARGAADEVIEVADLLGAGVANALPHVRHLEYFHDHACIETLMFDGALDPTGGVLRPDPDAPGHAHGMSLKTQDAEQWRVG